MPSVQAHLIAAMAGLLRVRRVFDGAERIAESVAKDRAKGPAIPSAKLRTRVSVREEEAGGRRVYTISPHGGHPARHLLYLHGGGWSLSITGLHWDLVANLAERLDCAVTVPLFPLAPEHTARDLFAMLLPLYAGLAGHDDLTVMGDSSGANVALSLVMQARSRGLPQPARTVLLSPVVDATFGNPAITAADRTDPIVPARGLPVLARNYGGDLDPRDPVLSPLYGTVDGLAPVALFIGTREVLNPDAHRFREMAAQSGFPLSWHEYPGMVHVWPLFPIPEAKRALDEIATFVTGDRPR